MPAFGNAQAQLVRELGAIVRNQVPSGRASVLEAYGEILLRGWRAAAGACLFEVEALIQARTWGAIAATALGPYFCPDIWTKRIEHQAMFMISRSIKIILV